MVTGIGSEKTTHYEIPVERLFDEAKPEVSWCLPIRKEDELKKDHQADSRGHYRGYHKSALVIVDEVGYTPVSREESNLFFRFVSHRYEKASTIITSNKAFTDWAELFNDPVIITAILDRLLHHSVVVNIKGNSYRLKGKIGKETETMKSA